MGARYPIPRQHYIAARAASKARPSAHSAARISADESAGAGRRAWHGGNAGEGGHARARAHAREAAPCAGETHSRPNVKHGWLESKTVFGTSSPSGHRRSRRTAAPAN